MKATSSIIRHLLLVLFFGGLLPGTADADFIPLPSSPVVLTGVPSYAWYHGCGPTAAASIIGYWDLKGYDNLFSNATGWDEVKQTSFVEDEISSPAHNEKYDPADDSPDLPSPQDTSIADFFKTSEGLSAYGESPFDYMDDALEGYAAYKDYSFKSEYKYYLWLTPQLLITEIDHGRPLLFFVDTGVVDAYGNHKYHYIPVFGYHERDDGLYYAYYTTTSSSEDEDGWTDPLSDLSWNRFQFDYSAEGFGVKYVATAVPQETPVPGTLILFSTGLAALAGSRKKYLKKLSR